MSQPLRVALVTNYPSDAGRIVGGVQAVSVRLVEELQRVPDLELHVIHCHSDITESRVVRQGPVTLHYMAQSRRRVIPNMASAVRQIAGRLRAIGPNVVHAHGPHLAVAALEAGYPTIWTIHSVLAQEALNYQGLFHRLRFALAQHYERQALAGAQTITAVSPYVVKAYEARTPSRIQVIENPAPRACFALPRRPVPGRIVVPAAVIPLKDPLTLIRAAGQIRERVKDLSVRLAGGLRDAAYVAEVRAEIARWGLQEAVSLPGVLTAGQMMREYSEAELVALPSRHEICPMAVVEAMAAGVPVVASAVGGVPHLVADGVTGRTPPAGDPRAWADALLFILGHPEVSERMGSAARQAAMARFAPEQVAGQYLALYRAVAGQTPVPQKGATGDENVPHVPGIFQSAWHVGDGFSGKDRGPE